PLSLGTDPGVVCGAAPAVALQSRALNAASSSTAADCGRRARVWYGMTGPGALGKGGQYMRSAGAAMFRHKSSSACRFCVTAATGHCAELAAVTERTFPSIPT